MDKINWTELCKGCGECCGPIPFKKALFDKNKHLAQRKFKLFPFAKGFVIPVADPPYCIFLDKNKRCVIYEERPEICRLQGTIPELPCPKIHDKLTIAKKEAEMDDFIEHLKR